MAIRAPGIGQYVRRIAGSPRGAKSGIVRAVRGVEMGSPYSVMLDVETALGVKRWALTSVAWSDATKKDG